MTATLSDRLSSEFVNTPLTDYSSPANAAAQREAVERVRNQLGVSYPLIIHGEKIHTSATITSINPARPDEVVGVLSSASREDADKALAAAAEVFETWRFTPPEKRAQYLIDAAELMTQRRLELNAWLMFETGKTWVEADADVAEAIDFLNFYAREMWRLSQEQPITHIPGEENKLTYIPLGVGVVIPPWNFPMAIMAGMTTASVVAGNTVVLKPASTSAVIAARFVAIMEEVGLPKGVINFVPGSGSVIGDYLVADKRTRFIAFTGSRDVGLRINKLAAEHQPGQLWIKRAILEMGGKDAIVVDETADLDAAAAGIVSSAFGFQGQKCSAGSRAIIVAQVYDEVVAKALQIAQKIVIGDPEVEGIGFGPVIDANAFQKIREYIAIGQQEATLALGGEDAGRAGYYIPPTIFTNVDGAARIAQEEIFGPVLAMIKASDFEDAMHIANSTEYGLTGAVYSRDETRLAHAAEVFHVGNLYFNRKCTGALVGAHPFGGFNMSGTDSKAGGRDYLLLFTQAKVVSAKKVN